MASNWLSSQQGKARASYDIRRYIRVHGRVLGQNNSTARLEEGDNFYITSQPNQHRSTKQLTLMDLKRKQSSQPLNGSISKEEKAVQEEESKFDLTSHRLFLPALKFSTGVRRKATKDVANKENVQSQEAKSPNKASSAVPGSALRGVSHISPCSVEKPKRDRHYPPPLSQSPTQRQGRRRKSNEQKENEVMIESSGHFLSSRRPRAAQDKHQLHHRDASLEVQRSSAYQARAVVLCPAPSALRVSRTECETYQTGGDRGIRDVQDYRGGDVNVCSKLEGKESTNDENAGVSESSDSDVYINTEELLAELSNCEKRLLKLIWRVNSHNNFIHQ